MNKISLAVFSFILLFTFVPLAYGQADPNCAGAPMPRLVVGAQGRVLPGDANNVRDTASRSGTLTGSIPGGEVFEVLDGPVCADGLNWWQVTYGGLTGWTVEGSGADYWIEPYAVASPEVQVSSTPEPTPEPAVPVGNFAPPIEAINVLEIGAQVRVVNDDPTTDTVNLTIRAEPSRGAGAMTQAVEGDLLTVVGGPEEADGLRWWQVETASGIQGWAIEGLVNADRDGVYERTLLPLCPVQGTRIAYRVIDYLVTSAPDGSDPCVLDLVDELAWTTFSPTQFRFDNNFLISPDGEYILYRSGGTLYRLKQDGSERLMLTHDMVVGWAAWSPDGARIAIATGDQIATMRADGSSFAYLTQGRGARAWVGWQSDSETVIYLEQSDWLDQIGTAIQYTVYRINLREGGLRALLQAPLELDLTDVALSADGTLLAVSGVRYGLIDRGPDLDKLYDLDTSLGASTWIIDLETETTTVDLDTVLYKIAWLPDNSALVDVGYLDQPAGLSIIPVNGDSPTAMALTGDTVANEYRDFIGWQSPSAFLTYVGYGFQIESADFRLWEVDVTTGEVQRLR